ncbi:MAG: DUF262 domain-containing protein [Chloroflexi bacterium]|nr:DUF262 domain-containing protein [Chloroflexota bacterium]
MFQRLYIWQENPQWATLWEDIEEKADLQLKGITSNAHYLGALIIEGVRPTSPREVKRFLVIDGQQRLATLQLVFCSFRDIARKNDWKTLDRATTRYLENADRDVMERPDEEAFKLWPTTLNRDVFRDIISAGSRAAVEARYPLIKLPRKRKPEPRSKLIEAYLYFSRMIESWIEQTVTIGKTSEECAFALLQALQQDFSVVEIALSDGDDSQEIFYSLNSQGRPLSQSDLLRSLIFMRAEKEKLDRDAIFEDYWSRFETQFWSTEVKRGGRAYSRLDLGLRYFLMAKTGEMVDARRVNEAYQRWIGVQPPRYPTLREELADFSRYGNAYQRYESSPSSKLPSTDLRRILTDFDVSTAVPLILYLELDAGLNAEQTAECLFVVESFIARRLLTGDETKEYNKLFVEIIGGLRDLASEQVKPALCKLMLAGGGTTRRWPTDAEVLENVISRKIYSELKISALRLILERLEIALRGKKSESTFIAEGLQIEHVLPQKWSTYWTLKGEVIPPIVADYPMMAKDELVELGDAIRIRNAALQTLGNLTLLNPYLNPAASNGSFVLKLEEYKNSVLRLNRYFDTTKDWDEKSIMERSIKLGDILCKIWPRPKEA